MQERVAAPSPEDIAAEAVLARERIASRITRTPLVRSTALSERLGGDVMLKLENRQETGSFKLRGAMNRLLSLPADVTACVAASSGNHGAAVARAMQAIGLDGVIFVPEQTSETKLELMHRYGARIERFGTDGLDTEQHARTFADANGLFYVSPYNDRAVIAGQATIGLELLEQLDRIDRLFVAVGGGGLLAGVASVLKCRKPGIEVIACQPRASAVMRASVEAGRIVQLESKPTLSDGTAGGIEADAITFDLCRRLTDRFIVVDEAAIADAMRRCDAEEGFRVEGAAGVALAAAADYGERLRGTSVIIVCGQNVSEQTWAGVTGQGGAKRRHPAPAGANKGTGTR